MNEILRIEYNIPESQPQQYQPIYIYQYWLQWKTEGSQVHQLDQMEDPIEVANIFLLLFRISTQDEANAPSC
jgi:hypothetical protein